MLLSFESRLARLSLLFLSRLLTEFLIFLTRDKLFLLLLLGAKAKAKAEAEAAKVVSRLSRFSAASASRPRFRACPSRDMRLPLNRREVSPKSSRSAVSSFCASKTSGLGSSCFGPWMRKLGKRRRRKPSIRRSERHTSSGIKSSFLRRTCNAGNENGRKRSWINGLKRHRN